MSEPKDLNDDDLNMVTGGSGPASLPSTMPNKFGTDMDIPAMMMGIQLERSNLLDSQIKDQMGDMKERNDWLREANDVLGVLRSNRPAVDGSGVASFGTISHQDADGSTRAINVDDWLKQNGMAVKDAGADHKGTQAEFDANIQTLKTSIDTTNSQSQMDMIRLQSLMDKRNQAFDLMTNTLSKLGKQQNDIIGNMR